MKRQQHFNKPQLRSLVLGAPTEVVVAGRATGKTVGILAPKSAKCYFHSMPRGTGVIVNATYTQAYTRTLKELIRGWQMLGLVADHHFIVGRRPSEAWIKKWKWKGPFAPPVEYKHFISWYNGAVAQLISQDRPGSSNGISIDWIIGDEVKLLNEEKLKSELFPANRGIIPDFVNNPYHHGYTFTTDMPIGSSGRWILDMAGKMDKQQILKIWNIQSVIHKFKELQVNVAKLQKAKFDDAIDLLKEELNDARQGVFYYQRASTLDNIHALGIEYIKQQMRDTSEFLFDVQILNLEPARLEAGFYPDFDEDVHGYFAEEETYFDNQNIDYLNPSLTCRKDKDLIPDAPLHIALDYNRRIHPIVVGQDNGKEIKALNGLHALYPGKLKQAMELFNDYYKPHKRRLIYYWYDHTAVGDDNETRKCDEVIGYLRKGGWVVKPMYIALQPAHETRYRMWGHLLTNDKYYNRTFSINRENSNDLISSITHTEAEKKKDGFGKNKKPEHDDKIPATEAPHYSDALDTMVYGMLESKLPYGIENKASGGYVMAN